MWLGFVQRKKGPFCFYYVDYLHFVKFPLVYNSHFDYSFIVIFKKIVKKIPFRIPIKFCGFFWRIVML
jgi:hypothetical protein